MIDIEYNIKIVTKVVNCCIFRFFYLYAFCRILWSSTAYQMKHASRSAMACNLHQEIPPPCSSVSSFCLISVLVKTFTLAFPSGLKIMASSRPHTVFLHIQASLNVNSVLSDWKWILHAWTSGVCIITWSFLLCRKYVHVLFTGIFYFICWNNSTWFIIQCNVIFRTLDFLSGLLRLNAQENCVKVNSHANCE